MKKFLLLCVVRVLYSPFSVVSVFSVVNFSGRPTTKHTSTSAMAASDTDNLPHLETFVKAAELSSFTSAARALGLTQAAVSQRIQGLEKSLKSSLFHRQSGHVLLTDAGHCLYGYALRIIALHREAIGEITGLVKPLTGELLLAASSVPGEHLLPDLLAKFQEKHSHVQVRASITDSREVLGLVEQGHVHLGMVGGRSDSPNLEFRVFGSDELALIVSAKHALAGKKRITLKQLASEPLIVRESGSASRSCFEQELAKTGQSLHDLRIALELGSNEAIKEAVQRGMGVAVLSTRAVQKEITAGTLHTIEIAGLNLTRDMLVVWDRRRVLPIPARLFLDILDAPPSSKRVG